MRKLNNWNSESSGEEVEQLAVPDTISPVETHEKIPDGGKVPAVEKHIASSKTKCWLFFTGAGYFSKYLQKVQHMY